MDFWSALIWLHTSSYNNFNGNGFPWKFPLFLIFFLNDIIRSMCATVDRPPLNLQWLCSIVWVLCLLRTCKNPIHIYLSACLENKITQSVFRKLLYVSSKNKTLEILWKTFSLGVLFYNYTTKRMNSNQSQAINNIKCILINSHKNFTNKTKKSFLYFRSQ